mgnify:FL=1
MPDFVNVNYAQTGGSISVSHLGMREMQERAYEARFSEYLLLKAPPASGKSRALMFLALDKLKHQKIRKVIVAVPERSIGSSFAPTELKKHGFFADWNPRDEYNLCTPGADGSASKVQKFHAFMDGDAKMLICTHATLRFGAEGLSEKVFDGCLLAIDEFHHVSADADNRLGELIRSIMAISSAHIIAMTGSYFRGDNVPVLLPNDERKFTKVTYNYYEQLNGYSHLKSLGIGYHFYQGKYTNAIMEVLDTDRKTILHIPNVNSGESTKQKYEEVNHILDQIGEVVKQDPATGVLHVKRITDGKVLKVADLVEDDPKSRDRIVDYLRGVESAEDMDLIIALGMAKEGFDWPFCEHALTVGYRGSLTEIIQIIGRATRDSDGKHHAQFTNLIAQPDAEDDQVKASVNNMLKAITASLLMEQVLAPNWTFKTKRSDDDINDEPGTLKVRGLKEPSTQKVKDILASDLNDLKAALFQDKDMLKGMPGNIDPEVINKVLIPKVIKIKYPGLSEDEIEEVRQHVVVDSVIKNGDIKEQGDMRFVRMADSFVNIEDIHIDLIDQVNPFQKAFEVLSKAVDTKTLRIIQDAIEATRVDISQEEAVILWPKILLYKQTFGKEPSLSANDPQVRRLAECLSYLRTEKRKRQAND